MATISTVTAAIRPSSLLSPIPASTAQAPTVNSRYRGKKYEYVPCEASQTAATGPMASAVMNAASRQATAQARTARMMSAVAAEVE
jgi:hypothetical protein